MPYEFNEGIVRPDVVHGGANDLEVELNAAFAAVNGVRAGDFAQRPSIAPFHLQRPRSYCTIPFNMRQYVLSGLQATSGVWDIPAGAMAGPARGILDSLTVRWDNEPGALVYTVRLVEARSGAILFSRVGAAAPGFVAVLPAIAIGRRTVLVLRVERVPAWSPVDLVGSVLVRLGHRG